MNQGFQFLDIILFAMIAAFLVLRLRSVLGRRTGHQSRPPDNMTQRRKDSDAEGNVIDLSDRTSADRDDDDEPDEGEQAREDGYGVTRHCRAGF